MIGRLRFILFVCVVVVVSLTTSVCSQTNRLDPTGGKYISGMNAWSGDLEFHKKTAIADGGDSLFAAGVDSAYAFGVSDTTWSEVYRSKGSTSIQFEVTGTLTASYIEVWTANSGDYQPQWLPEKYFRPAYWVVTGTGMANNYVSTSKDSVTAAAITLPIFIPMLDGELFKVLYITSPVNGAAEKSWLHAHVQLREGDN